MKNVIIDTAGILAPAPAPTEPSVVVQIQPLGTQYQVYFQPGKGAYFPPPSYALRDDKPYVTDSAVQAVGVCQDFRDKFPKHLYEVHALQISRVIDVKVGGEELAQSIAPPPSFVSWAFQKKSEHPLLDNLKLGQVYEGFQDIDADAQDEIHSAIAKVVVSMDGGETPYKPGVELAKRITWIPQMLEALRSIANPKPDTCFLDYQVRARAILDVLGVNYVAEDQ